MGVKELRKRYLSVIHDNQREIGPVSVSSNTKTGHSVNLAIVGSCQPTKECERYCYGLRGPIVFKNSLLVQHNNLERFKVLEKASEEEVEREARSIIRQLKGAAWVRWNGVGDLVPGSVRVINAIARLYPNVTQWVVTRKPEQVQTLQDSPSIAILFSLDKTTPEKVLQKALSLQKTFQKAMFQFSWTQTEENDIAPDCVSIVFNKHIGRNAKDWNDSRVCHATVKGNSHEGSCDECRRCFEKH